MQHRSWLRGLLVLVCLVGFLRLVIAAPLVVSVINVGQGDSILVQFPNGQDMLVDAGDQGHGTTVVKYLRSRGVKRIDILVASHPHADHIGGMAAVTAAFPVGKVWDSGYNQGSRTQQQFLKTIQQKHIPYGKPRAGFSQSVGGVRIDVLAPGKTLLTGTDSDANNNSLVMRLVYGTTSLLLPGDMEEAERASISHWPHTTVLKVAHHGSRNGTDLDFARALMPRIAVISYGEGNEYEHPHPEAVTALRDVGATIYRTATQGTIILSSDGSHVTAKTLGVTRAAATTDSCAYIGNRQTHIYHLPTASHLPKPENRVCFSSREAAERAGYRPCQLCFR